jgi:hypothetical protein
MQIKWSSGASSNNRTLKQWRTLQTPTYTEESWFQMAYVAHDLTRQVLLLWTSLEKPSKRDLTKSRFK